MATGNGAATGTDEPPVTPKVIVAIHGVGSQLRGDTIRAAASRFGALTRPPQPLEPLGHFNSGGDGFSQLLGVHARHIDAQLCAQEAHNDQRYDDELDAAEKRDATHRAAAERADGGRLAGIWRRLRARIHERLRVRAYERIHARYHARRDELQARRLKLSAVENLYFAEAYWADVPVQIVKAADTLEDVKAWGRTVASRIGSAYARNCGEAPDDELQLAGGVIDEIVEGVAVLENLLFLAGKMGVFKFDLAPLLRDYVGDVQVVAEFAQHRAVIVKRFHDLMASVVARFQGEVEIYVVAHSEGTVVSFLAMLQALSQPGGAGAASFDWIEKLRGYMTFGSPIDKHLVLWEDLWSGLRPDVRQLAQPIQWRNYYDYGDPIGFELETAVAYLDENGCEAFDFDLDDGKRRDFGFSRYWLPGKAHNDYWTDAAVFGHFIDDVVYPVKSAKAPGNLPLRGVVGTAIPYAASVAMQLVAVFALFKAVVAFVTHGGVAAKAPAMLVPGTFALGALLAGASFAARLPRLARRDVERAAQALALFAAGALGFVAWVPDDLAAFFGTSFACGANAPCSGRLGLVGCAAAIALTGWFAPRSPRWGRRILLGVGSAGVLALIGERLWQASSATHAPAWPLVLGGAAFLYAWWLGIILFDLAFVWHRYIRQSVGTGTLRRWYRDPLARDRREERRGGGA